MRWGLRAAHPCPGRPASLAAPLSQQPWPAGEQETGGGREARQEE